MRPGSSPVQSTDYVKYPVKIKENFTDFVSPRRASDVILRGGVITTPPPPTLSSQTL
jgi:hypothetical protein